MQKKAISQQNLSKLAVKTSAYNLISILILKFGGLIFTVVLARMLLPELFGIYALALSIATLAITFTDWGMENTFLRYLSESIGKNNKEKSRSLAGYFFKTRFILIIIVVLILAIFSKYLSYNIYNKPLLFYPLIFSCLFIIAESFRTFLTIFFTAKKEMKSILFFDASSQTLKILFAVFAILILSNKFVLSGLFIAFFISSLLTLMLEFFILLKKDKELVFGKKGSFDKSKVNSYWKFMALAIVSLSIFGSIDILMLGRFVSSEYLAYYRTSLSLILSIASLLSLSSIFLPIFTQINGKRFSRGFHKTLRYMLMLSIPITAGVIFLSNYLIKAVYGNQYLLGTSSLYFLSILIITTPLIGLYSTILQSKAKSKIVGNSIVISLILSILLNLLAIFLFKGNDLYTINAVGFATSISRIVLLGLLIFQVKKEFKFSVRGIGLRAPIFATLIMSIFLLSFKYLINMNILWGILEIILGAGIYFGLLILFKGITKEDFYLVKSLFKRR
jgi:O-antigen/teichoic acid export membrane protein